MNVPLIVAVLTSLPLHALPLPAQVRPDLSGIWRLVPEESQMIGGGGPPSDGYQLTWLVDHRDPEISVVVNVRNGDDTVEFAFRCTTDGRECVNELPLIQEVRRMSATWDGEDLVMSQQVSSQRGGFEARDRVSLTDSGQRLVFERTVTNDAGERPVRQVFQLLGPHPSQRAAPDPLPTVELPPELDRVLRDYERHWRAGEADALVSLFTEDGFVARRGGWVRGQDALREGLEGTSSDLRLRAVEYAVDGSVGYLIGAYGYGDQPGIPDRGMFILALRRAEDGRWLIAADLDGAIRP